jgi:hypothetical protein
MGINDKLAATFHPRTFTCDFCHEEWRNPISAAMCCDVAAPGPADNDHQTRPRYELGYD